jgi:hypothetical protein
MSDEKDEKLSGLNKWDSSSLKLWTTLAIFASRGGGKSFCVRDLLYKNRHKFPAIIVICPTEPVNKFYQSIIPDIFIFDELNEDTIEAIKKIYKRQTELAQEMPPWMKTEEDRTVLIIMDDCMASEKKHLNSLTVRDIYKMGRHYKFSLIVIVQYFNDLSIDLRHNLDYAIILKCTNKGMQHKFQEFLGGFDDKYEFAQVLQKYTDKYGCLVKDGTTGSTDIRKQFFWYRAEQTPDDFKMNPDQWLVHKAHYISRDAAIGKMDWNKFSENPLSIIDGTKVEDKKDSKSKNSKKKPFGVLYHYDEHGNIIDED